MRSREDTVDRWVAVRRALDLALCGVGGRLTRPPDGARDAVLAVDRAHGERLARRLERFVAIPVGAHVWTSDEDGLFHRGELTGQWHFDDSEAAFEADLVHVRACDWLDRDLPTHQVPAAVVAAFDRGGRNFQRIRAAPT